MWRNDQVWRRWKASQENKGAKITVVFLNQPSRDFISVTAIFPAPLDPPRWNLTGLPVNDTGGWPPLPLDTADVGEGRWNVINEAMAEKKTTQKKVRFWSLTVWSLSPPNRNRIPIPYFSRWKELFSKCLQSECSLRSVSGFKYGFRWSLIYVFFQRVGHVRLFLGMVTMDLEYTYIFFYIFN